ncbi:MAG: stage III sporulation protein AA [Pseudoflavonifractor sp.]
MDERFLQAAALLPTHLRREAEQLPGERQTLAEELRLRVGRPLTVLYPDGEATIPGCKDTPITACHLTQVMEIATQASVHTVLDRVCSGFVTVRGGHRVGICGSCVTKEGQVTNLRQISSLAIRIARAVPGAAAQVLPALLERGRLSSTLLLSPPGLGKTTLLRDLIRSVSEGEGTVPLRVGVADERGELAAMYDGAPQLDLGRRTDVVDGCPKATGLLMLLRGMNPQVLAADEITAPEDCGALCMAANCGVALLATAHGESLVDLKQRPLYRSLLEQNIFRRVVTIERVSGQRRYRVAEQSGAKC